MLYLAVAVAAYLIGAVPFAFIIVRLLTGRDIRTLGTGNVGVMNTIRQAGVPAGLIVFLAEGLKGIVAFGVGQYFLGTDGELLSAFMALVGVNWSVFVGFAGGRGTTASIFMLMLISLTGFFILAAVWFGLYGIRRNNFLSTRAVIFLMPLVAFGVTEDWRYVLCAVGMSSVLLLRHRKETDDHLIAAESERSAVRG